MTQLVKDDGEAPPPQVWGAGKSRKNPICFPVPPKLGARGLSTLSLSTHRRLRQQRGMGLLEAVLCIALMSLMFLGAMDLILSAGRSTVRTQSQVYSNSDAANAVQRVIGQLREASTFSLPTSGTPGTPESTWTALAGTQTARFSTALNGQAINTGMEVVLPPLLTTQANGYTATQANGSLVPNIEVLSTTGGVWQAGHGTWTAPPTTNQQIGGVAASIVYLIYRGDPDGTPDPDPTGNPNPKAGTYLWQYQIPNPPVFNPALYPNALSVLCKSVAPAPNAVQFVRPFAAQSGANPDQTQVEIKIISSYYSPINGRQTSEEGSGATSSQLSGKSVYMRDHCTDGSSSTTTPGVRTGNNTFQYH